MKKFAIIENNKITAIRIAQDIKHLKDKLRKDCDIIEVSNKGVKVGQTWSHFPTFKKIAGKVRNLFAKKAE